MSGTGVPSPGPQIIPVVQRDPGAIYQYDRFGRELRIVGRVEGPVVDEAVQEVRFAEIYQSDDLVLADEFEFRKYRLQAKRIGFATRLDKEVPHKKRVLRDVTAKLLGYCEQ